MNTNPPLKQDVVTYEDFQIQLLALDPYPEDRGQHIPAKAYKATFIVTERPLRFYIPAGYALPKGHSQ